MVARKKVLVEKPLTEVELELMNVIWDLGDCTVKEVQTRLAKGRDLAYTSVATMIKILEQKGALASRKDDRAHTYHPLLTRVDYEASSLRHLAEHVFNGDPTSMVMRLLDQSKLTQDELRSIRNLLDERLRK